MGVIQKKGERLTLNVVSPTYKTKLIALRDFDGKLIKGPDGKSIKQEQDIYIKDIEVPTGFSIDSITMTGGVMTKRGTINKTQCVIYDKYTGRFYTVAHSRTDVEDAIGLYDTAPPIGFMAHIQHNSKPRNKS